MDTALMWRSYFANWPARANRRGVVVTSLGEQVAFSEFLMTEHFVMFVRDAPDANGGRRILLPYGNVAALKVTDPVNDDIFLEAGFVREVAKGKK